jgi:hypothetical protein
MPNRFMQKPQKIRLIAMSLLKAGRTLLGLGEF